MILGAASPFFPGILLSGKHQKPCENGWLLKRMMAEKNGESTARMISLFSTRQVAHVKWEMSPCKGGSSISRSKSDCDGMPQKQTTSANTEQGLLLAALRGACRSPLLWSQRLCRPIRDLDWKIWNGAKAIHLRESDTCLLYLPLICGFAR